MIYKVINIPTEQNCRDIILIVESIPIMQVVIINKFYQFNTIISFFEFQSRKNHFAVFFLGKECTAIYNNFFVFANFVSTSGEVIEMFILCNGFIKILPYIFIRVFMFI